MIFTSPRPDIQIPKIPLTPYVLRHADRLADKAAIIDGLSGDILTYGQLAAAVRTAAAALADRGFRKGDVFAISAPNVPEYAIALLAVVSLGGIVTPVNPAAVADELARQVNDAGATYLLTVPDCLERAAATGELSGLREIVVLGDAPGYTSFSSLLAASGSPPTVSIRPGEDLAVLPYSSGTTGRPKGVMLTHANLVANAAQIAGCGVVDERDTLIGVLPFSHIYGLTVLTAFTLAIGATIVTLPRFELESFLSALETYRVTFAHLVPPIVLALAKQPAVERYDLSRLSTIMCGGAPIGADVVAACQERIGCHLFQGYGLTETSPTTHLGTPDPERIEPTSIGLLLPKTEAKFVHPASGAELDADEQGELWIRGPQVMRGYLHQPAATAATIATDGWLRTGDLGYADAAGNFYVVDRLKDLIKYKGYQVAPAELEAVLLAHPAVADAAVIPSPDDEAGEVPKAFVVLKGEASADDLMAFIAARVAPYKKVRRLEFIDQIPKSASGKILRRRLVERERAAERIPVLI